MGRSLHLWFCASRITFRGSSFSIPNTLSVTGTVLLTRVAIQVGSTLFDRSLHFALDEILSLENSRDDIVYISLFYYLSELKETGGDVRC